MSMEVLVETSARHVHVTKEVLETLFGKGYELTKKKDLSQPGQFASNERVDVWDRKSPCPACPFSDRCARRPRWSCR